MVPILTQVQKDDLEQQLRAEIREMGSIDSWNDYICDCGSDALRRAWSSYGSDNSSLEETVEQLLEKFEQEGL